MVKRKVRKVADTGYSFIYARVTGHTAEVECSVSYDVRDERWRHGDNKVYSLKTRLEIKARCIYPEETPDEEYHFTIYGSDRHMEELSKTLDDCHVIDDKWQKVYKTVKGKEVPVYKIPKGLPGDFSRRRGEKAWSSWIYSGHTARMTSEERFRSDHFIVLILTPS